MLYIIIIPQYMIALVLATDSTSPQTTSLVPRLRSLSLSFSQELTYMQMCGKEVYRRLKREGESLVGLNPVRGPSGHGLREHHYVVLTVHALHMGG